MLFGLALDMSGVVLGTAIVLGMNNALGALLLVGLFHREQLATRTGLLLIAGVGLMLAGVALCAWAGSTREVPPEQSGHIPNTRSKNRLRKGVLVAIVTGVLGMMFNSPWSSAIRCEVWRSAPAAVRSTRITPYGASPCWADSL